MIYYLILALFSGLLLACYITCSVTQTTILYRQLAEGNTAALWMVIGITIMSLLGIIIAKQGRGKARLLAYDCICILIMSTLTYLQQGAMEGVSNFYRAIVAILQGAVYSFIPICVNGLMSVIFLLVWECRKRNDPDLCTSDTQLLR